MEARPCRATRQEALFPTRRSTHHRLRQKCVPAELLAGSAVRGKFHLTCKQSEILEPLRSDSDSDLAAAPANPVRLAEGIKEDGY